jgi:hypothetical protein
VTITGAGRIPSLFLESPYWEKTVDDALKSYGVQRGTFAFLQLSQLFQWIIDPNEPANWAKHLIKEPLEGLAPKKVLAQVSEFDAQIPPHLMKFLAEQLGVDLTNTTMWGAEHSYLAVPDPIESVMFAARAQIVHFFLTGEICKPNFAEGTCP